MDKTLGKIRKDGTRYIIDFRYKARGVDGDKTKDYGKLVSNRGKRIENLEEASFILYGIRKDVADGLPIEDAIERFKAVSTSNSGIEYWMNRFWEYLQKRYHHPEGTMISTKQFAAYEGWMGRTQLPGQDLTARQIAEIRKNHEVSRKTGSKGFKHWKEKYGIHRDAVLRILNSPLTPKEYVAERNARRGDHFIFWRHKSIFEITTATNEQFDRWLMDRPAINNKKTRVNVMRGWGKFINFLREECREFNRNYHGKLPDYGTASNPVESPEMQCRPYIDVTTQRQVLDAIPEDVRGIFEFGSAFASRPGEPPAIWFQDINWDTREIQIAAAIDGGGVPGAPLRRRPELDNRKRKKNNQVLILRAPDVLWNWLMKWVWPRVQKAKASDSISVMIDLESSFVFINPNTERGFRNAEINRIWKAACTEVGVSISFHRGTRHSTLTTVIEASGGDLRQAQALAQHSDPKITETYNSSSRALQLPALEKVAELRR